MKNYEEIKKINNSNDGISIIVPFLNEEMTLPVFCDTMNAFIRDLAFPVEFVFVNDGSTDDSLRILWEYSFDKKTSVKVINLSKNFGFHSAVRAGLMNASYDICTWFSADLQEPLEIIQIAYDKIHNGSCEVVYFSKRTVGVSKLNRFCSKIYSHLMQKYAIKTYSSDGTATVAFGKKVKNYLNKNVERNSEIVLQIMDMGFQYESLALDYHARTVGKSKWSLSKKIKLFIDSFVAFSYMPIRLVSIVGILMLIIGFAAGLFTIINKILNPSILAGYSTIICVLVMGFGITNISLGIIAEYIWRTLDAVRDRPVFVISEIYNISGEKEYENIYS